MEVEGGKVQLFNSIESRCNYWIHLNACHLRQRTRNTQTVKVELCLDLDALSALSSQESQHHSTFPGGEVDREAPPVWCGCPERTEIWAGSCEKHHLRSYCSSVVQGGRLQHLDPLAVGQREERGTRQRWNRLYCPPFRSALPSGL